MPGCYEEVFQMLTATQAPGRKTFPSLLPVVAAAVKFSSRDSSRVSVGPRASNKKSGKQKPCDAEGFFSVSGRSGKCCRGWRSVGICKHVTLVNHHSLTSSNSSASTCLGWADNGNAGSVMFRIDLI